MQLCRLAIPTFIISLLAVPGVVRAAVTINEIAWMGTANSANDEWIELYNNGTAAVDVTDWRLTDGQNLDVVLSGAGSVAAGARVVLERTDDASAPGTAFFIYTGALSNTGVTLYLYDASGNLVDQVAGGENWQNIGGDNTTKETAQYTSGGWITAVSSPGSANAMPADIKSSTSNANTTTNNNTSSNTGSSNVSSNSENNSSDGSLKLSVQAPAVGFVGQPIDFVAAVSGPAADARAGRHVKWNFGDTYTDTNSMVTHQYQYPGTYIVHVFARYRGNEDMVRREITILPVQLAITRDRSGVIQLSNTAPYELSLGGFQVVSGEQSYTIPDDTYLKANNTLTLPPKIFSAASLGLISVKDQLGAVVASHTPGVNTEPNTSPPSPPTQEVASHTTTETNPTTTLATTNLEPATPKPTVKQNTAAVIEAIPTKSEDSEPVGHNRYAYLALIAVLSIAVLALLAKNISTDGEPVYEE